MTNDNKRNLRVVESDEKKKELISFLKTAMEIVEREDCTGVMISIVAESGDVINIVSATQKRHIMVSAALYQLLDVAGVNEGKKND